MVTQMTGTGLVLMDRIVLALGLADHMDSLNFVTDLAGKRALMDSAPGSVSSSSSPGWDARRFAAGCG